jgi:hypothetical protein
MGQSENVRSVPYQALSTTKTGTPGTIQTGTPMTTVHKRAPPEILFTLQR